MLILEIEFLAGVCYAAQSQSSPYPDWPPQPDRVFSALVSAWGSRGEDPEERKALEWLEQQPVPWLEASDANPRFVGTSFVPPNDAGRASLETLPAQRGRQPRFFPAAVPDQPIMRLHWTESPTTEILVALASLAKDTAYLGHSASLVRCRFVDETQTPLQALAAAASVAAERTVYPGRLALLERDFHAGRRPNPGEPAPDSRPTRLSAPESIFGRHWLIFEDAGGWSPDLRTAGLLGRRVRDTLMHHYDGQPPEFVSGHQPGGEPSRDPHLTVVPLADVGFEYSEGRLMGFAIVLPRQLEQIRAQQQKDWLAGLASDPQWQTFRRAVDRLAHLEFGKPGASDKGVWNVAAIAESSKKSLQPARYLSAAHAWASVTPIVLDRFLKEKDLAAREAEATSLLSTACRNIGLPEPQSVRISKHSAFRGVPGATPSGRNPAWMGWRLPSAFENRMLTHVVVTFAEKVRGPVILGAGRFVGLGLCLPLPEGRNA